MALPSDKDSTVFVGVVQSTPLMDWLRLFFRYRVVTFDVIEGLSGLSGARCGWKPKWAEAIAATALSRVAPI